MAKGRWHEIVKYRPENYKARVYTVNEWTSPSDIGKCYSNQLLTMDEYLRIENNYLFTLKDIYIASACSYLYIHHAEIHARWIKERLKHSKFKEPLDEILPFILSVEEETRVSVEKAVELFRYCLREYIYIEFTNNSRGVAANCGDDYYMHVKTPLSNKVLEDIVSKYDLYLDPR